MANTPDLDLLRDEPEPEDLGDDGVLECGDGEGDELIDCEGEEDLEAEATETGFTLSPDVSDATRERVASVVIGKPRSN